jgi:glycosyltransferase involved in cell wall biosynthesis
MSIWRDTLREKTIVVMPAYNAAETVSKTYMDIPPGSVDDVILVDDASSDDTVERARALGIRVIVHDQNRGYGANQKTCYAEALRSGGDIIVMIHPDYQYDPRLIPFAMGFISSGVCDIVMGSRIRTRRETLQGGMPLYKYMSNRALTIIENIVLGQNLGDFHSGFRVYKREVLEKVDYSGNSDDFVFDTEFLVQAVYHGFRIGDIPIPTRYSPESSSIDFTRSVKYGLQTLLVLAKYMLQQSRLFRFRLFEPAPSGYSEERPQDP